MMKIVINNQLIEYKDEGSGKTVLLLHGWGADMTTFDRIAGRLVKKFRVIRFDFPGFGQSPRPADDWAIADYASLTSDLLKKLKIEDVYAVIAHSFGGRVMIKGASLNCIRSEKIVLIGSAGIKPRQSAKKKLYKGLAKAGKIATSLPILSKARSILRERLYSSAGSTDYLKSGNMRGIFVNAINEDLTHEIKDINQSTLLLWGKNDTETPLSDAKLMLGSLNNGQLIVIPDAGHFVYLEAFDQVANELDKFLA